MPKNNAIKFEVLHLPPMNTNSFLVSVGADAVIFDAWGKADDWKKILSERGLNLRAIYSTHGHPDHISAAPVLARAFNVDWFLNDKDNFLIGWGNGLLDMFSIPHIDNNYKKPINLSVGTVEILPGISMDIFESPGHTPGGLMFYLPKYEILMVGDTLFQESYGNTNFPGGDEKQLFESIKNLYKKDLPNGTWVIHGHGMETSIGWLKQNNQFFKA